MNRDIFLKQYGGAFVIISFMLFAVAVLMFFHKQSQNPLNQKQPSPTVIPVKGVIITVPPKAETRKVTITATDYSFKPDTVTVYEGEIVEVTLRVQKGQHNIVISEYGLKSPFVPSDSEQTFSFEATQSGSFKFYSALPLEQHNVTMSGVLRVEPAL